MQLKRERIQRLHSVVNKHAELNFREKFVPKKKVHDETSDSPNEGIQGTSSMTAVESLKMIDSLIVNIFTKPDVTAGIVDNGEDKEWSTARPFDLNSLPTDTVLKGGFHVESNFDLSKLLQTTSYVCASEDYPYDRKATAIDEWYKSQRCWIFPSCPLPASILKYTMDINEFRTLNNPNRLWDFPTADEQNSFMGVMRGRKLQWHDSVLSALDLLISGNLQRFIVFIRSENSINKRNSEMGVSTSVASSATFYSDVAEGTRLDQKSRTFHGIIVGAPYKLFTRLTDLGASPIALIPYENGSHSPTSDNGYFSWQKRSTISASLSAEAAAAASSEGRTIIITGKLALSIAVDCISEDVFLHKYFNFPKSCTDIPKIVATGP